jgi:AcrR family transcriptional regulator
MPGLWDQSVQTHRRTVHDAVLDATAKLVDRRGLASVTMAGIATEAGIGRATLYKYFSDVDAVLLAWHQRHIADHLEQLATVRDRADGPAQRLHAVVQAYAGLRRHQPRGQIATNLHRGSHVDDAAHQLRAMLANVIADAATAGAARNDVPALELAVFCESALAAATELDTADGVERLVRVALAGLGARA